MNKLTKLFLILFLAIVLISSVLYFARQGFSTSKRNSGTASYNNFDFVTGDIVPRPVTIINPDTQVESTEAEKRIYTDAETGISFECIGSPCPFHKETSDINYLKEQAEANLPGEVFIKSGKFITYDLFGPFVNVYTPDYMTGNADLGEFGHLSDVPEYILRDKKNILSTICDNKDISSLRGCDVAKCGIYNNNPKIVVKYSSCDSPQAYGRFVHEEAYILTDSLEYPLISVINEGEFFTPTSASMKSSYTNEDEYYNAITKEEEEIGKKIVQELKDGSGGPGKNIKEFSQFLESIKLVHR